MPTVSIVVPNYNYGRYLRETLDHVVAQTFHDWELIVVDDNSTDGSRQIVEDYIRRYPQYRISLVVNDCGPSGTPTPINIGIRHMRGAFFAWLSSDDVFEPEKLEVQLAAFYARPSLGMVHSAFTTIDDNSRATGSFYPPNEFETDMFTALLDGNFINGNTVLIRRHVIEAVGPFLETDPAYPDLWRAAEYYHWLKIASLYPIECLQRPLHRSRRHSGNAEYNSSAMGNALERMLIRRFFAEHDVRITPQIVLSLFGRGMTSLGLDCLQRLEEKDQRHATALLEALEQDQDRWDIGQYSGIRHLDNGRIRAAFKTGSHAMLQAVSRLERPQTKPYRRAALARLQAAARTPAECHA